jgi:putative tryptophan/tyrosine transport system substrate-binding protein
MRRRDFINIMTLGAVAWPLTVRAERPNSASLIGVLLATRADDAQSKGFMTALDNTVREHGSASSPNIKFEYRFAAGDTDLTQAFARELISMRPAVIVAVSNTSMAALHRESTTIPIVFVNVSDPVGMGYVNSLSRPGGSVTGLTPFEPSLGSKWLSFLKELAPGVEDVGVMFNPEPGNNSHSFLRSIEGAAGSFAIKKVMTPHGESADIERTIIDLGKTLHSGLVFLPDALTYARRNTIVELIAQQRIPAIYPWRDFVVAGGLISYGPGIAYGDELVRQAAVYVNRILNGEKPAELPVQAPTKLTIAVNARTAKTLGLQIPATLIALADEVIE